MPGAINTVRGVEDILPSGIQLWQEIEREARSLLEAFGYSEIRTALFERTELFSRSIGEETDIVSKEMYTFPDRKGQLLTLRPEGTASVVRAYLQHNLHADSRGQKLYYIGPMFRYERPQAGRTRQFHQIGAEYFGASEPLADAEQLILIYNLFKRLWESRGTSALAKKEMPFLIQLNTLGCRSCRPDYIKRLKKHLAPLLSKFCEDCQKRYKANPLRILDCKNSVCKRLLEGVPAMTDSLCQECEQHFSHVCKLLNEIEIPYRLNPFLVRGLDYYTRTTFEVTSHLLGAQNAIAGGGRYDHLVEEFGGHPTPACGFALGMERLILALRGDTFQKAESPPIFLFFATLGDAARSKSFSLMTRLRLEGIPSEIDCQGHALKNQLRQADRQGAFYTIIMGDNELSRGCVLLRNMKTSEQEDIPLTDIVEVIHAKYKAVCCDLNKKPME